MTKLFRLKRQKEEAWVEYQTRTSIMAKKIWVQMKRPFLYEKNAEIMWRTMVWACNEKENAVIFFLKKMYKWRSTTWWQSLHKRMMKDDPENQTRWKHQWRWHNRGNVWDKMASCWAGKKDWMIARKKQNSSDDKYNFITNILNKMKLSTEHGKQERKM